MSAMAMPAPQGEAGAPQPQDDSAEKADVLKDYNSFIKHAKSHWAEWRTEAQMLYDLKSGRQWDKADEDKMREELRPLVTFNVADKYSDIITGLQINNRQEIRYYPRTEGAAQVDELLTGAVGWGGDLCNAVDEETDAFNDAMWTGLGWMEGYLDKDLEPGGVPARQRVDNMEMYADPAARKRNLEDARKICRLKPMDHDEYMELAGEDADGYGDDDEERSSIESDESEDIQVIGSPHDYPDTQGGTADSSAKRGKCIVADYQYWKREKRIVMKHPQMGEKELTEEEFKQYEPFLAKLAEQGAKTGKKLGISITPIKRKVYYRAFIAKGKVLQHGLSPYQEGFTYHAITGKRDRNKNTWYGVGRAIVDPQKWLNKFFSSILYTLMCNAKGGILAEENTFKDARKAESEWGNPNSITWVKDGALQKEKIMPKPPAVYPQGMDRLMDFSLNSLPQVTGMPVELLGLADRMQSGVLEAQRKQSAMSVIAWAFDAMRRYYKSVGRQMARYVIDYVPEGTLIMVNGEKSKQFMPLLKQKMAIQFTTIVDEAPTSVNQQERVWTLLEGMIPQLISAGIPITPKVLDYAPLPPDLIQAWKETLQGDPKKQQMDEQQMQTALRKLMSEALKNETQAKLNEAKAEEAGATTDLKSMQAIETAAHAGAAQAQPTNFGASNGTR